MSLTYVKGKSKKEKYSAFKLEQDIKKKFKKEKEEKKKKILEALEFGKFTKKKTSYKSGNPLKQFLKSSNKTIVNVGK